MNKKFLGGIAVVGLLLAGGAQAVPCGYYGVEPSGQCQNGIGSLDSQTILNSNSYFGIDNWQFLDRVTANTDDLSDPNFWRVVGAHRGLPGGTFTLANGMWNGFSSLAVSLAGIGQGAWPGPWPSAGPPVNWSLYELINGTMSYEWIYGATRNGNLKNVFTVTLYGVRVSEPGTIGLLLMGAVAIVLLSARRREAVAV